jgi:hypothetical protein
MNIINNNSSGATASVGYSLSYDDRSSLTRNNTFPNGIVRGISGNPTSTNLPANNSYQPQVYNVGINIVYPNNATAANRSKISINFGADTQNNILTNNASISNATDNLTLCKNSNASTFFLKGDMVEIIISQNQPTPTQLTQLNTYLTSKYGTFPIV